MLKQIKKFLEKKKAVKELDKKYSKLTSEDINSSEMYAYDGASDEFQGKSLYAYRIDLLKEAKALLAQMDEDIPVSLEFAIQDRLISIKELLGLRDLLSLDEAIAKDEVYEEILREYLKINELD